MELFVMALELPSKRHCADARLKAVPPRTVLGA